MLIAQSQSLRLIRGSCHRGTDVVLCAPFSPDYGFVVDCDVQLFSFDDVCVLWSLNFKFCLQVCFLLGTFLRKSNKKDIRIKLINGEDWKIPHSIVAKRLPSVNITPRKIQAL